MAAFNHTAPKPAAPAAELKEIHRELSEFAKALGDRVARVLSSEDAKGEALVLAHDIACATRHLKRTAP